jgi:hypothetical protein
MLVIGVEDITDVGSPEIEDMLLAFDSISIALVYNTATDMCVAAPIVDHWKVAYHDRVNFLRPDTVSTCGAWYVSEEKLLDNAVCDTVRVKYIPRCISHAPPVLGDYARQVFSLCSQIYAEYRMYHRAITDGYFAVRADSKSFLITSTKTVKTEVISERVSRVVHYDSAANELTYEGRFLPSSDAVEAAIVFEAHPAIRGLMHTHASSLFTRNARYESHIRVPQLPYGDPLLGNALAVALGDTDDGFIIMKEHGEVFALSERHIGNQLIHIRRLAQAALHE